ncbi:hypothetical protein ElyMa_000490100 [Elysia marginata]|uniref:Uncharacterized protein n=1 Tax=Elysia marginata TaxID=1093978 RepID=A0AAV4FWT0_9GAST|nr:hypothetical protein ElyMa_000490100 [Elysia marginata]
MLRGEWYPGIFWEEELRTECHRVIGIVRTNMWCITFIMGNSFNRREREISILREKTDERKIKWKLLVLVSRTACNRLTNYGDQPVPGLPAQGPHHHQSGDRVGKTVFSRLRRLDFQKRCWDKNLANSDHWLPPWSSSPSSSQSLQSTVNSNSNNNNSNHHRKQESIGKGSTTHSALSTESG